MNKIQKAFAIVMTTILLLFIGLGGSLVAFAESEAEQPPTPIEETETDIDGVADKFLAYLKDKYGADYELYYNSIIEQWGSIEGYLLAFGDKLPEEQQSGWNKFVAWLNDYAVIWVPILAVLILISVAIIGRKKIKKIKDWFTGLVEKLVNKKLAPITNELNLQSKATISILHAQKALLGTSEKFAENVAELNEAEKELTDG